MADENTLARPVTTSYDNTKTFQPLTAGTYWRAKVAIKNCDIKRGDVLLLQSIRDNAEGDSHTIVLRSHPRDGGDNKIQFLVDEFLKKFAFEPDGEAIRETEIAEVFRLVEKLKGELTTPAPLALSAPDLADDTTAVGHGELNLASAIQHGITPQSIAEFRSVVKLKADEAERQALTIGSKVQEIANVVNSLTPFYAEKAAAVLARTEDVQAFAKRIMKGIESLDLYIGKNVVVETIRQGESAPESEPLALFQRKLFMEEEFAVWADVDDKFDFKDEPAFFAALKANDSLVTQLFPFPRGVLTMAVRREEINYGDRWTNADRNAINKAVFLLIRDGENLYRVHSPVESHVTAKRLFPAAGESDEKFKRPSFFGLDGSTITYQDVEYTDRLRDHEAMELHYKRLLILLCGLDHRERLFGTFCPGPPTFEFVKQEFQQNYFRFVHDDNGPGTLLAEGRMPFKEWIEAKNAALQSGSRVFCLWNKLMTAETAPGAFRGVSERWGSRDRKTADSKEPDGQKIVFMADGELCVELVCESDSYDYKQGRDKQRVFNCRLSLTKYTAERYSGLGFLCLDDIEPDDLNWYIHDRESREDHLRYIRMFKSALKIIRTERATEIPTRSYLKESLTAGHIASGAQADAVIQRAIVAWRAAHRGAYLPDVGAPDHNRNNVKSLLNQMFLLAGNAAKLMPTVDAFARELGCEPLRLITSGTSKLAVYVEPKKEERDDRLLPQPWVHRITIQPSRSGVISEVSRKWALLPPISSSETLIHQWPQADKWMASDSGPFESRAHKDHVFAVIDSFQSRIKAWTQPMSTFEAEETMFELKTRRRELSKGGRVSEPTLLIPFAVTYRDSDDYRNHALMYQGLGTEDVWELLWRLAPDKLRPAIIDTYVGLYAMKDSRLQDFHAAIERGDGVLRLMKIKVEAFEDIERFQRSGWCVFNRHRDDSFTLSLAEQIKLVLAGKDNKKRPLSWMPGGVLKLIERLPVTHQQTLTTT